MDETLAKIIQIAESAGQAIMEIYEKADLKVDLKADKSPLTEADRIANVLICQALVDLDPSIPILSEENSSVPFTERSTWSRFWLVDPLDGTKEFLNRNGEFTVNIALIENRRPVMGVVLAPAMNLLYFASTKEGAWKRENIARPEKIHVRKPTPDRLTAVVSRSHSSPQEQALLERMGVIETIPSGSSLKFCLVADGSADLYYRNGPTSEWDTAAGQCVATLSGAEVLISETNAELRYQKEEVINPPFLCSSVILKTKK